MRRIYLIRHGLPEKSTSEKEYIGVTDLPLSTRGSAEAAQLGHYFLQHLLATTTVRIVTSPLQRCRQTVEEIQRVLSDGGIKLPEPLVVEALHEIDLGEWEGKSVREIREHFPEAYEARGHALGTYQTPDGESFLVAGVRFHNAMEEILEDSDRSGILPFGKRSEAPNSDGNESDHAGEKDARLPDTATSEILLVVAHAGVIRAYLSLLMGRNLDHLMDIPLPYASVTELQLSRKGIDVVPDHIGVRPEELLDAAEIARLYQKYETPPRVIRHMRKVAELAGQLMDGIPMPGLNRARVMKACLLHDLRRTVKQHARVSAEVIRKEGYPGIAALVAGHHQAAYSEQEAKGPLTEAEILFYADKRVQEDKLVSVEERFRESRKKCRSPEACAQHDAMLAKTLKIEEKIRCLLKDAMM